MIGSPTVEKYCEPTLFQFASNAPAYKLTFTDWPEEIGIDNLVINPNGLGPFVVGAPAPPSGLLLGMGALGLAGFTVRSRRRMGVVA